MLEELQRLHANILLHLEDLDMLTSEDQPSIVELTATRLALTRASRARRALLDRIYEELTPSADPMAKAALAALQAEGNENLKRSAAHIGEWALEDLRRRWSDYCVASMKLRTEMRQRVAVEKKVIYPLLGNADEAVKVS